jgi:hypothetical protein
MTADVPETAEMLSAAPMFSKAVELGDLVHSFIVIVSQLLSTGVRFELDVLNLARERTRRRIFLLGRAIQL